MTWQLPLRPLSKDISADSFPYISFVYKQLCRSIADRKLQLLFRIKIILFTLQRTPTRYLKCLICILWTQKQNNVYGNVWTHIPKHCICAKLKAVLFRNMYYLRFMRLYLTIASFTHCLCSKEVKGVTYITQP